MENAGTVSPQKTRREKSSAVLGKTFFSHLFSYLISMLIPVCILGYISQDYFLDYFTESLLENKSYTLINIKNTIDGQIAQMQSFASNMTGNQVYTTKYQLRRFAQFYEICAGLSSLRFSSEFLSDLQLFNNELGYVYTPDARFTYGHYVDYGPAWPALSAEDTERLFRGLSGPAWIPIQPVGGRNEKALTYLFPIAQEGGRAEIAVMFRVSEETLEKVAGASMPDANSRFFIADRQGAVLYSSANMSDPPDEAFWASLEGGGDGPVVMSGERGRIIAYRFASEVSDLQYVSVIDYEEIIKPIASLRGVFLFGMLAVTVIGSLAIVLFMKRNYSPIRSLRKISREALPELHGKLGDLETVELAITTMLQKGRDVESENRRRTRDDLLLNLFRSRIGSPEDFIARCQSVDMFFPGPWYRVAVFSYGQAEECRDTLYDNLCRFMTSAFPLEAEYYMLDYAEDNSVWIVFSGSKKEMAELEDALRTLREGLELLVPAFTIGLSIPYDSIEKSEQACRQAVGAARYQSPSQTSAVIRYEQLTGEDLNSAYPSQSITTLYNAILSGDSGRVEFAIDMLIPYFSYVGSVFFVVCLGYDIINTALRAMRTMNYPGFEFGKKYPDLLLRTGFHSTEEIVSIVKMLSIEICEYMERGSPSGGRGQAKPADVLGDILGYIGESYTDQGFSAKTLADHFGMSISNFSHYFKNRTGKVVSAYISTLRYERAKELLRGTDLTLGEVAEKAGYYHVSTFLRQFRSKENMTPSTYRGQFRYEST